MSNIRVTMRWIKNQGTEFINGKMDGHIKAIFKMISGMVMGSFMIEKNVYIEDIGKMGNKLTQKDLQES